MDEKLALEELQFIRKVIEDTKKSAVYNGMDYIFWGVLVILGMMSSYIFHINNIHFNYGLIWAILIPIGWFFSFYNAYRKKSLHKNARTFASKIIGAIWGATGFGMTIIGFLGPILGKMDGIYISPILSIMMGGAYFVTGVIVKSKWTAYLSIGWWIGGIILFTVHNINQFLIMSAMMLFFQTVPGIIFYRKYKLEVQKNCE